MNDPLSPSAQAVLDAFKNASDGEYVEGVWVVNERTMLAAALKAAADQSENLYDPHEGKVSIVRAEKLLAIAAELKQ